MVYVFRSMFLYRNKYKYNSVILSTVNSGNFVSL